MSILQTIASTRPKNAKENSQKYISWLLAGDYGTGKTHLSSTARQPILYFSFDPGGTSINPILSLEKKGLAYCITDWETDNQRSPFAFEGAVNQFAKLQKAGIFEHIGTLVFDGLTGIGDYAMSYITAKDFVHSVKDRKPRPASLPQQPDYWYLWSHIQSFIFAGLSQPCDFILTAHLKLDKDEITGATTTSLFVSGRSSNTLPGKFSEVYITDVDKGEYRVLTQPYLRYRARTRIGGGIFDTWEKPDLMALRAKAGREVPHLPPLT